MPRRTCPRKCGRSYNPSAGNGCCTRCLKRDRAAKEIRRSSVGTSSQFPGHEERMRLYRSRAAKEQPLFDG